MRLTPFRSSHWRKIRIDRGRVYLRPPKQRDWKVWSRVRQESREFLVPWEPTWPHDALTRSAFRRRVRAYHQEMRQGTSYSFLIFRASDNALLGGITLSNIRRGVSQTASLGYWIGARHARQGYMSESLSAVLDFSFGHLGMHRIEAACLPRNMASRALLTKIGFSEEGYARQYLRINGSWQDHVLFAVLRDDPRVAPAETQDPVVEERGLLAQTRFSLGNRY